MNWVVTARVSQNLMAMMILRDSFSMTRVFRFPEEINWPPIKIDFIFVSTHQLQRKSE